MRAVGTPLSIAKTSLDTAADTLRPIDPDWAEQVGQVRWDLGPTIPTAAHARAVCLLCHAWEARAQSLRAAAFREKTNDVVPLVEASMAFLDAAAALQRILWDHEMQARGLR